MASLTYGYQTAGFISTATIISTTQGLQYAYQTAGFVSSPNLLNLVSTTALNTSLASTVQGLGSASYISTTQLTSTVASLVYGYQTAGFISTATLVSTVGGLGNVYISTIRSTFLTLSTGSITTSSLNFYDPINSNTMNTITVRSTLLYFNTLVVAGARVAQPQTFTF